jgi:hypothetical protein
MRLYDGEAAHRGRAADPTAGRRVGVTPTASDDTERTISGQYDTSDRR